MGNLINFAIYLITDRTQLPAGLSLLAATEAALRGGVRAVQLREKDLSAAELLPLACELRALTNDYAARLLINDRIDVALACQADGVHLGGHSLPTATARKILGPDHLIGVSTHSCGDIARAARQGADFVTFGPVYATPSKAAYGKPMGLDGLRAACRSAEVPVLALGGIKLHNKADVLAAGASGIALISAIFASSDPENATRNFCLS